MDTLPLKERLLSHNHQNAYYLCHTDQDSRTQRYKSRYQYKSNIYLIVLILVKYILYKFKSLARGSILGPVHTGLYGLGLGPVTSHVYCSMFWTLGLWATLVKTWRVLGSFSV